MLEHTFRTDKKREFFNRINDKLTDSFINIIFTGGKS